MRNVKSAKVCGRQKTEELKTWGRSAQKRVGEDWHCFFIRPEHRSVSTGNGSSIAAKTFPNAEQSARRRSIHSTRSRRSSTAMMLSTPFLKLSGMTRGKGGQTSSVSLAGVFSVQRSRRLRRRGDPKPRVRHRLQTCTSDCHACISSFVISCSSVQKSNINSRISSGSMFIDVTGLHRVESVSSCCKIVPNKRPTVHRFCLVPSESGDDSLVSTGFLNGNLL